MNPVTALLVYVIIWTVVLFAVLPWGVRVAEEGDLGHAVGAPGRPRILFKLIITSLIAAALWIVFFLVERAGLFSFR
jgi:predicted secreted protein